MFASVSARPPFALQQNSFGFANTAATSTPFGQTQNFINNTPSTGFNQGVGGFGATTPMFGSIGANPQSSAPLFGSTNTSTFGTSQSGFGTTLFGSNQQQPSTSGLFGTNNAFGQQSKPAGFGFAQNQPNTLFGQTQPNQQNNTLFQPSSSTNVFGTANTFGANNQTGTIFKFVPVTGTDSMQKSGIAQTISTKHHCITCMKEYEGKSLEELRYEDYQANRRGPQQQGTFTAQPFGATASSAPTMFGQTENKSAFGQGTTFGQTTGFGIGNQTNTSQGLFGKTPGFGTTTTASTSFGFGTNAASNNIFGANGQNKFGAQATPLFGQQQNTGFGATSTLFGQNNTQNSNSIFGKPNQTTPFSQPTQYFAFGQPAATQNSTVFGQTTKPNNGFSLFGNTNTSTSAFGQQSGFNNTFGKPAQTTFGQPAQNTFGTTLGMQNTGLFGNNSKPGGLFGNTNTNGSLFNNNVFQPANGFNMQPQQQAPQNLVAPSTCQTEMKSLIQMTSPYGIQNCLEGLTPMKTFNSSYATNPKEIQKLLDSPKSTPNDSPNNRRAKVAPAVSKKKLFEDSEKNGDHKLTLRTTPKRLVINKSSPVVGDDNGSNHIDLTNGFCNGTDIIIPDLPINLISHKTFEHLKRIINEKESDTDDEFVDAAPNSAKGVIRAIEAVNSLLNESSNGCDKIPVKSNSTGTYKFKSDDSSASSEGKDSPPRVLDGSKTLNAHDEHKTTDLSEDKEIMNNSTFYKNAIPMVNGVVNGLILPSPKIKEIKNKIVDNADICGITLKRPEYYTIPEFKKLSEHKSSDGSCIVTGLTIGRMGYGNVFFPDSINIANLNLDEIVHFRYRELTIYPDDTTKPPLGNGLNRRAQVTLDRVWPKEKDSHFVIDDVDTLIAINFTDTLKNLCEKHGTKFVDYRPETGSWVFKVEHFSKYGFTESDEEKVAESVEKIKKDKEEKKKKEELQLEQKQISYLAEDSRTSGLGGIAGGGERLRRSISPITSRSFCSPSESKILAHHESNKSLFRGDGGDSGLFLMKASFFDEDSMSDMSSTDMRLIEQHLEIVPEPPIVIDIINEQENREGREKTTFKLKSNYGYIPIHHSLISHRNYQDIAIFKGHSFKVCWLKGLQFTTTTILTQPADDSDTIEEMTCECNYQDNSEYSSIITNRVIQIMTVTQMVETKSDTFQKFLINYLKVLFNTCQCTLSSMVPLYSNNQGHITLTQNQFLASQIVFEHPNDAQSLYHKDIWNLCQAFWGSKENTSLSRRELFSKWLEDIALKNQNVELELRTYRGNIDVFQKLYNFLTVHQIEEAAKFAIDNNLPQLSLMLSQLNCSKAAKSIFSYQINQWNNCTSIEFINESLSKLYLILAGSLENQQVNICDSLEWRKAVAMHLWYVSPTERSLTHAINLYEEAFDTLGRAKPPNPLYQENAESKFYDIQFQLMKLFGDNNKPLEQVLNPFTHTEDPTDYRLSWVLLQTLNALHVGLISENAKNHIHVNFAFQLENMGLYKWAIFVLLFIKDFCLKEYLVIGVLERNMPSEYDDVELEYELVRSYKIPTDWIHFVKANKSTSMVKYWPLYRHLSFTRKWNECHDLIMSKILPDLIINEYYDVIENILGTLYEGTEEILNWKVRGGLLNDFTKIRRSLVVDKDIRCKEHVYGIHGEVVDLCRRMLLYPRNTPKELVCASEISKYALAYLKTLLIVLGHDSENFFVNIDAKIEDFLMPPDYLIDEVIESIVDHFRSNFEKKEVDEVLEP